MVDSDDPEGGSDEAENEDQRPNGGGEGAQEDEVSALNSVSRPVI